MCRGAATYAARPVTGVTMGKLMLLTLGIGLGVMAAVFVDAYTTRGAGAGGTRA